MAKIHVHTKFSLIKDDGEMLSFAPGNHDVPDDVADHWYVKVHSGEPAQAVRDSEDDAAADFAEQRASLESAAKFLEERAEQLSQAQSDLDARAADLKAREDALTAREAEFAAKAAGASAQQELVAKDSGAHQGQRKQGK